MNNLLRRRIGREDDVTPDPHSMIDPSDEKHHMCTHLHQSRHHDDCQGRHTQIPSENVVTSAGRGFVTDPRGCELAHESRRLNQQYSEENRRRQLLLSSSNVERSATPIVGGGRRLQSVAPEINRCYSEDDRPLARDHRQVHNLSDEHSKPKITNKLLLRPPHSFLARFGWKDKTNSKSIQGPAAHEDDVEQVDHKTARGSSGNNASVNTKCAQSRTSSNDKELADSRNRQRRPTRQRIGFGGLGRISEDAAEVIDAERENNPEIVSVLSNEKGSRGNSKSIKRSINRIPTLSKMSKHKTRSHELVLPRASPCSDDNFYNDDDEVMSTHSDRQTSSSCPNFRRNDRFRSSLPVVGTPNKSQERPLGLVFLTFRNETKRGLLPNEITAMSTVWALFVRAFSDQLSMAWFEMSKCTVCILDKSASVYFVLQDFRCIRDRSVLKIFEDGDVIPGMNLPCNTSPTPNFIGSHPSSPNTIGSHSTTANVIGGHSCDPPVQHSLRSRMRDTGNICQPQITAHKTSDIAHDHASNVNYPSAVYSNISGPAQQKLLSVTNCFETVSTYPPDAKRAASLNDTSDRMCKMETQLASLAVIVQNAIVQQRDLQHSRPASVLSSHSANSDASQVTVKSISHQVQPCSSEFDWHSRLVQLLNETSALRAELARIRQMHQVQAVLHKEAVYKTFVKIKEAIESIPITILPAAAAKTKDDLLQAEKKSYVEEAFVINNALKELELSVEKLRSDVVSRRCDVDVASVESTAAVLSQIGRLLADHKLKLQLLVNKLKSFMTSKEELERIVSEEQGQLEKLLIRWKQLAGTLSTLRKLAMVQNNEGQTRNSNNDTSPTSGSKHRSILHKPELCLPTEETEKDEKVHQRRRMPACPAIYINNSPLQLSKSTSTTALMCPPSACGESRVDPSVGVDSPQVAEIDGGLIAQKFRPNKPSRSKLLSKMSTGVQNNATLQQVLETGLPELSGTSSESDSSSSSRRCALHGPQSTGPQPQPAASLKSDKQKEKRPTKPDNTTDSIDFQKLSFFTPRRLPPEPPPRKNPDINGQNQHPQSPCYQGSKTKIASNYMPTYHQPISSDDNYNEEDDVLIEDDDVFSPNETILTDDLILNRPDQEQYNRKQHNLAAVHYNNKQASARDMLLHKNVCNSHSSADHSSNMQPSTRHQDGHAHPNNSQLLPPTVCSQKILADSNHASKSDTVNSSLGNTTTKLIIPSQTKVPKPISNKRS